jgi:hypothetical protein
MGWLVLTTQIAAGLLLHDLVLALLRLLTK